MNGNRRNVQAFSPPAAERRLSFRKLAAGRPAGVDRRDTAPAGGVSAGGKLLYRQAAGYLGQVLDAVRRRKGFSAAAGLKLMRHMAEEPTLAEPLLSLAIHLDEPSRFPVLHGVNVAVYSLRLAADLGHPLSRQVEIGLAGLLHDVGMALVPEAVVFKKGPLADAERALLRDRTEAAARILGGLGADFAYLAECAGQVCERVDGSGYPRGLAGDEIHPYARIVGLADVYESLIHSRPHRGKLTCFAAFKEIFSTAKHRFEHRLLKALLNVFTVFPIHSWVRLNSGAVGRVIATRADQPLRPRLVVVLDAHGRRVPAPKVLDLAQAPLLHIVDGLHEAQVAALLKGCGRAAAENREIAQTNIEELVV